MRFYKTSLFIGRTYNNDGGNGGGGDSGSNGNGSGGTNPTTFTQEQVNTMIATEKKKFQAKQTELATQLQQLQQAKGLTETEKTALAERIEQLQNESLTKEQQLTRDLDRLKVTGEESAKTLTSRAEMAEKRFAQLMITNELTRAAAKHKAVSADQILAMVMKDARAVAKKDADGNPTDTYEVLIKFDDVDVKTGKPIQLDMTPEALVKRMSELTDRFGNLFESGVKGGTGGNNTGNTGEVDIRKMSHEQYREYRKTRQL